MGQQQKKKVVLLDLSVWLYIIRFLVKICTNSVLLLASLGQKYSKENGIKQRSCNTNCV